MKYIFTAVLLISISSSACAQETSEQKSTETKLTTTQIKELIEGKTTKGLHYGVETRQYFSKSGLTLWIKEGDETPSEAKYKIENDQYCSSWTGLWAETDYGCFNITFDKEQNVHYFIKENFRAPFIINDGFDLIP